MNQQAAASQNGVPKTPGYAWVVLFALYMATLSATLTLSKVQPVSTIIQKVFNVDMVKAGDLMSVFSIMGFVLAIPAGFILKRFGIKVTGLISVGAVVVGSVIGALAETSFTILYLGRFIEGVGMGLIMVTAPFAISVWFPLHNRALPTGLWATSVGIGNIVMFLTASDLAVRSGWQAVWWAGAGFAALSFILFAVLFRMPRQNEMEAAPAPAPQAEEKAPSLAKGLANVSFWMIAVAFGVYNLVVMAMISFLPQFLEFERGYSLTYDSGPLMNAGFVTAFVMAISVLSAPGGGYISDRLGKRKIMVVIPYILMTVTFLFPFTVTGWMIPLYMIVFGLVGGPIAPVLLAAVPEVAKKPQYIGIGMGVAALGQNLGVYLGTSQFPRIQAAVGWEAAGYWMIPICLIGIVATLCIKVR